MLYTHLIRPMLFELTANNPETAHDATINLLQYYNQEPWLSLLTTTIRPVRNPILHRNLWDTTFPNPVGLAGGFDKDGVAIPALAALGFGFLEIGTVTLQPQPGNPQPRLFRLPASTAVINRMGFNNHGIAALVSRLRKIWPAPVPIGVSLGKNKNTPDAEASAEYSKALKQLYPYLDYLAVNVSSPNTPGLRNLQNQHQLTELLSSLQDTLRCLAGSDKPKPLLLKIAPDLLPAQLLELLQVCLEQNIAGIIVANTTLSRDGLAGADQKLAAEVGGLSGKPLTIKARNLVARVHNETNGKLPIVGVGGIMTVDDALRMFDAGASLIQLYTGLVYSGVGLIRAINLALLQRHNS
ncbi:dihydroorotate dehydrogenase [Achromatium sp. WMS2]|nr:dihydroorotate dehydrogenase [Achromatium sp. WMS2]